MYRFQPNFAQPPSWKNRKITISQQQFVLSPRNLVSLSSLTILILPTVKISKIFNYVGGMKTYANPYGAPTTRVVSTNTWLVTCFGFLYLFYFILRFPHSSKSFDRYTGCARRTARVPVDRFWRSTRRMTCLCARKCLFAVTMRQFPI